MPFRASCCISVRIANRRTEPVFMRIFGFQSGDPNGIRTRITACLGLRGNRLKTQRISKISGRMGN